MLSWKSVWGGNIPFMTTTIKLVMERQQYISKICAAPIVITVLLQVHTDRTKL